MIVKEAPHDLLYQPANSAMSTSISLEKKKVLLKNIRFWGRYSQIYGLHHALVEQAGFRFAAKLREEWAYRLADYSHLLIEVTPDLNDREIRSWKRRMETWQQHVKYGLNKGMFHAYGVDQHDLMINIISEILLALAKYHNTDPEPILQAKQELLAGKEDTIIIMKSKIRQTDAYRLEPYFKVKGFRTEDIQLYVRLVDMASNQTGDWLVVQCSYREACDAISSFRIKNDKLVVKPKGQVDLYHACKFLGSPEVSVKSILGI